MNGNVLSLTPRFSGVSERPEAYQLFQQFRESSGCDRSGYRLLIGQSCAIEENRRPSWRTVRIIPPACGKRIRCERLPGHQVNAAFKHNRLIRLSVDSD